MKRKKYYYLLTIFLILKKKEMKLINFFFKKSWALLKLKIFFTISKKKITGHPINRGLTRTTLNGSRAKKNQIFSDQKYYNPNLINFQIKRDLPV